MNAPIDPASAFAQYARPELARLFRALHLDATYSRGRGDRLTWERPADGHRPAATVEVLDLVGGAGASLFGHNHPALVEVARRCLDEEVPFNAQGSFRPGAAELARRLSETVGATTGARYVVTFGCTGAEAVEAAVKHATVEHRRTLAALQEEDEQTLRRVRRDGVGHVACADGPAAGRPCEEVLTASIAAIAALRGTDPVLVSLKDAFHGKTAGAGTLTHGGNVPADLHVPGPEHRRLHDWSPQAVEGALDDAFVEAHRVTVDAAGVPHSAARRLSPLAACFAEPVQGEAGVREVPAETLAALRELADRHGAVLVFDEIQSGMGRTGTFLASEPSGVVADYYLFSKSLGGGLAKVSALLVAAERYVPDFGRHHTSTFADDEFSSRIATAALDLALSLREDVVATGALLRERLADVAARWPKAVAAVRGRGLLLGVEFRLPEPASGLLREVFDPESLGYLIAGRLLHTHRLRVIPTLSAPTTLRVQPSALLRAADVEHIAAAFDEVAGLLENGDHATLLAHLATPPDGPWQPRTPVPQPRGDRPTAAPGDVPRVVFLANLDVPGKLGAMAPELASWSPGQCADVLDRIQGELDPFEVARHRVASGTRGTVEVVMVAVPFTAAQANAALRAGQGRWLRRTVLDAVDLGVSLGAEVIGLGGHTSIVANAARDVVEDRVRVTSGNSLTAACAYDLLCRQLAEAGPGNRRVALVGAVGNIGAVMAELIAPHCESLLLVGRPGSARRLDAVAERLTGATQVSVCDDLTALRDCPIVVSATNAADPVILPHHLAGDRDVLVCDLAVPGDVHPAVAGLSNVTLVSGGRIALPHDQAPHFPGITLPPGVFYSCLAETMLLGLEPATASPSYGGLTPAGVLAARDLADRHLFRPARLVADDVTVRPWVADPLTRLVEERL
ncbi:aminotransferase class III-fold pyridoxal phosphate-dependent enzyme [Streptomyces sp. NPDC087440]|uniref:aminotransferase class III-fold pyridoxal phosphate-dependent enzyme n=1 Tax=Streptomyces sp. NPDC087440 TaxID=3365790 RepID=UPI0037FABBB0